MDFTPARIPAAAFTIASFAQAPKFPATRFANQEDFLNFLAVQQPVLDARYEYDNGLVVTGAAALTRRGTCAPCLRPTTFTSDAAGWERVGKIRRPAWRESMVCACPDRLRTRERALLHFVQATGMLPGTRLLLLGEPAAVDARLGTMASEVVQAARGVPAGLFQFAIVQEILQFVADVPGLLAALAAALVPGGRLVITLPFFHDFAHSEFLGEDAAANKFGWDLLDMLRDAGFRDAAAYLYWSEELGYFGPMNFIFRAVT
jgi:hypothetical protein